MTIKFGAFLPQGWRQELPDMDSPADQFDLLVRRAQEAEAAGFDSVWVYDHFHTVPTAEPKPVFEAWTTMAALARDTRTIRLGQMVTCNEYRPPGLVAKMASSVDAMSHGRLIVGMGAGWYREEFEAWGYDFPDTPDRLRHLREGVQVVKALWTQERAEFEGRYYRLRGAINEPKPVQQPHPPLWIGGGGEQVTLKLVAQYADGCNLGGDPATIRHKVDVLKRHCESVGRDEAEITRSTSVEDITGTAEAMAHDIRQRVAAGIDYVIVFLSDVAEGGVLRRFAEEVIPLVG